MSTSELTSPREGVFGADSDASTTDRGSGQTPRFHESIVVTEDPYTDAASQLRAVRTKLLSMNKGNPPRIITVCSGVRGEGKTTTTLNLAAALAEMNRGRVLVLDGDLLKPQIHMVAGIAEPKEGLLDALKEGVPIERCIHRTAMANLDMLAGTSAHEVNDMMGTIDAECAPLFKQLRETYDFILIDTPPVLHGSLAIILARRSEATLMVVRLEKTPREVVKRAVKELTDCQANVVGSILTHRRHHIPNFIYRFIGSPSSGYYYYYGSGKGNGTRRGDVAPKDDWATAPSSGGARTDVRAPAVPDDDSSTQTHDTPAPRSERALKTEPAARPEPMPAKERPPIAPAAPEKAAATEKPARMKKTNIMLWALVILLLLAAGGSIVAEEIRPGTVQGWVTYVKDHITAWTGNEAPRPSGL